MDTKLLYVVKARDYKMPFLDYEDDLKEYEEEEGGAIDTGLLSLVIGIMALEVFLLVMTWICPVIF